MNKTKLISSKIIVSELFSDYNISNTDWMNKIVRHIERAIGLMRVDGFFEKTALRAKVENYATLMPCDYKYLHHVLLYRDENNYLRIPIKNSFNNFTNIKDTDKHNYYEGYIQGDYLKTNFESDDIMFLYTTMPKDCDGYPMIPDNQFILEALPFYIIKKLSYSGYLHPVISREEASNEWKTLSIQARANYNFPSFDEMQSIVEVLNNPLIGDYLNNFYEM